MLGTLASASVYIYMVVPRLDVWPRVPAMWWMLVYAPWLASAVGSARIIRSVREGLLTALIAGLTISLLGAIAAELHFPGTAKSLYFEAPEQYWVTGTALNTLLCGAAVLLIYALWHRLSSQPAAA
jgi:hypothetical protein